MRYLDYSTDPTRPVLILIHGLGGCWQWWLEVLPALGAQRRVIAVDLPGFGHSEALPPPATMATHAKCIAELADGLELTDVTVAGHSMGGLVTLELARTRPDLVSATILVNAGGVPMSESRLRAVVGLIKGSRAFLANPTINRAIVRRPSARAAFSKLAIGNANALTSAREMQRRLPDPTLVVIPGTGHSPFIGRPDEFLTAVVEFTGAHTR
jgi:pimeloyl-ACP methyl ester carboxylesterase